MTGDSLTPRKHQLLQDLFSDLPTDFTSRYQHVTEIKQAFHTALAATLQQSLNQHLGELPQDSLEERRELSVTLNRLLHDVNLAIKCPRSGLPATIYADYVSNERPNDLRFRLQVVDSNGKHKKTVTAQDLPIPFELIPLAPRREGLARGHIPRGSAPLR